MEVMLAAARREKVEDRVAIAEAAGLTATVMDIESYAARRAACSARLDDAGADAGPEQIVALFQIGAQATHISVLQNGETIYEREQPFGGIQLTQDIVRAYGLSFEEAEARKKAGDLPDNYRGDLLAPFLENAALEVTRAIQFFFTSTPYTRIDQIYLAGGCALLPGLLDIIASRTRISSAVISPFKGMQLGAIGARTAAAQRSAGLPGRLRPGTAEVWLMIRINLLPHREAKRKQKQTAFAALLALGGLLGGALVLMVGALQRQPISTQNQRNQVLKQANAELDVKIKQDRQPEVRDRGAEGAPAGGRRPAGRPQPAGLPARRTGAPDAGRGLPEELQAGRPEGAAERRRAVAGTGRRTAAQPVGQFAVAGTPGPDRGARRHAGPEQDRTQGRRIHAERVDQARA